MTSFEEKRKYGGTEPRRDSGWGEKIEGQSFSS